MKMWKKAKRENLSVDSGLFFWGKTRNFLK